MCGCKKDEKGGTYAVFDERNLDILALRLS